MLTDKRIAIVGMGKMGMTVAQALIKADLVKSQSLVGSTAHQTTADRAHKECGIQVAVADPAIVRDADIVILALKPQTMSRVLTDFTPHIHAGQLVISLAAATPLARIQAALPEGTPLVRAMPNLPALVNEGMTVICAGQNVSPSHMKTAASVFSAFGLVELIDNEDLMDAVTALAGSGPAYGYIIIESLAEGGVKAGLPRSLATTLAAQAMRGAAAMVLETGEHPAKLKDMVTTPAGTTVDGIMALEEGSLRVALIKAVDAATAKSKELANS